MVKAEELSTLRYLTEKKVMSYETYLWYTGWAALYGDEKAMDALESSILAEESRKRLGLDFPQ